MYNELNINKYKTIRDAAGLVMRKSEKGDNPLAYTSKLVVYIQSQIAFKHLSLTNQQQKILKELQKRSQYVNLNYVYTSPLNDIKKFKQE